MQKHGEWAFQRVTCSGFLLVAPGDYESLILMVLVAELCWYLSGSVKVGSPLQKVPVMTSGQAGGEWHVSPHFHDSFVRLICSALCVIVLLEMKPRALCTISKCCATE